MKKLLWIVLVFLSSVALNSEIAFAYNYYGNNNYYINDSYDNNHKYSYDFHDNNNTNGYYYVNNNSYNYNDNYNYNWCFEWKTWPYSYPNLSNWATYTTKSWNTTATLKCSNWYVSVTKTQTYSDTYTNTQKDYCSAGRLWNYSYPQLGNWATYTTTVWNTTATLICNNWYVSVKSSNTKYPDNNNWKPEYSCKANSYASYSYPNMNEWETYANIKDITWWKLTTKLKCVNAYVSVYDSYATCNTGYYVSGKSCIKIQEKVNNKRHNYYNTSYYYYDDYFYDDYFYYDDYYYDDYYYDDYYYDDYYY